MKRLPITAGVTLGVAFSFALLYCVPHAASVVKPAEAQSKRYVCPSCGAACDDAVYDHPGTCPTCGMALVEEGARSAQAPGKPVAILLFDGVEIIDFSGPYEVFGAAGFDVYTVAQTTEAVTTAMGLRVVPKYSFANAPQPVVLVVPGGGVGGARKNAATLKWVSGMTAHTEETMSVCNGAFILGSAGLLDGLSATTTFHLLPKLASEFPKARVARDQRFVDNGKIITTAGLSAGIDGALHVVEKLLGVGAAQSAALEIEYDWHRDGGFVRAALADRLLPDVDFDSVGTWSVDRTEGTKDRWEIDAHGTSKISGADLKAQIDGAMTAKGWRSESPTVTSSEYRFEDETHAPWSGTLTIEARTADAHEYVVKVKIARAG